MGVIDHKGNIHGAAGSRAAGQFQRKSNRPPESTLDDTPALLNPGMRTGASLHRGIFGGYTVTNVQTYEGMEGEGFSATLRNKGVEVGHIVQEGNGGGTYCRFNNREDRAAFDRLVADEWAFERTYTNPGTTDPGSGAFSFPHDQEMVLDEIVEEHQIRKLLNDTRASGRVPVMFAHDVEKIDHHDNVAGYVTIGGSEPPAPTRSEIAAHLRDMGELDGAMYWDGDTWCEFDTDA